MYKVSNHAALRYSERIMNKDSNYDINKFTAENTDKINTDINKLIEYGTMIFSGKQSQKDGKGKVLDVYLKDTWIILVDSPATIVVTLFKVDLGCGDDFNMQYINKMMDKINQSKEHLNQVKSDVEQESKMYKDLMSENICQINEFKSMIKNLEELNSSYQSIIQNNCVKTSQAEREVADIVNSLVGKKEF